MQQRVTSDAKCVNTQIFRRLSASQLFSLRSTTMCIESLRFFDVVASKNNDIPPSGGMGAPPLKPHAVHAEGYLLGREGALHRAADEFIGGVKNSHHLLGCAADIIAGNRADHRKLFKLIVKMHQEGQIRFTQLIWGGAKGAPLATTEDLSSQRSAACGSDGRWIHISYVPSDLRCQVIGE